MKIAFLTLCFVCISHFSWAQVPSIQYIDIPGTEQPPTIVPSGSGGYFLTNTITKTSPDSTFASITYLDASMTPQWNRQLKSRATTYITNPEVENDGISVMLNVYNTQNQTIPVFYRFDANGNPLETIELQDSSTATLTTSPFFNKIKLANGSRVFTTTSSGMVVHIDAQGKADFARQFRFGNPATNLLAILAIAAVPGTNEWYISGYINNTGLAYLMKFQDTTMINTHVFNFQALTGSMSISNIHVLPNQDVLLGWNDNSQHMHNVKLSSTGQIIWRKLHKMSSQMNPGRMTVTSNGDIWMHGSISPGQAGGILVHLSPTGQFIGKRGQFKLGNSHGNISSLVELPNNELLTIQKGYYETKSVFFLNRIQTSMNFYCFDSNVANFIDTTYAISDSMTTQILPVIRRFGSKSTLTVPLKTQNLTGVIGNVVCTPTTDVEELVSEKEIQLYPNPATNSLQISGIEGQPTVRIRSMDGRVLESKTYTGEVSVSDLPAGIYLLEIQSLGLRKRFLKE